VPRRTCGTAPTGLVVPRRYTALPGWAAAAADPTHGEVQVRASGGGLVPQGPGVWNLSLAWPAPSAAPSGTDAIYRALCDALAGALRAAGLDASPQPVDGSFCDGRFNLAVRGRKLVGTAQAWRRVLGVPLVLAHAVIVVDADPAALTARANAFEAALGSAMRYRADALTSVAREAGDTFDAASTLAVLAEATSPAWSRRAGINRSRRTMVLLEFAMAPGGKGESVSEYVARILDIIDRSACPTSSRPWAPSSKATGTTVMGVVGACFKALQADCTRIGMNLKMDYRAGPAAGSRQPKTEADLELRDDRPGAQARQRLDLSKPSTRLCGLGRPSHWSTTVMPLASWLT
jgi:lipoate-protein ligase A/uncharacterized protein YqgV (UPF0045/DUF77 family)